MSILYAAGIGFVGWWLIYLVFLFLRMIVKDILGIKPPIVGA